MGDYPKWLPPIVPLAAYGDWKYYVETLYEFHLDDFVRNDFIINEQHVRVRRYPQYDGKDKNFWHIVGDDKPGDEAELRRYERIRWPRPITLNRNDSACTIKIWAESDHHGAAGKLRHHIWFNNEYLVVIEEREKYYLFITAYPTDWPHGRRNLEKRYMNNRTEKCI